jgi:hypothetical protein
MPMKFEPTRKILVNRQAKIYKTVHSYMHNTSTDKIMEAYNNANTKPKLKVKYRNELVRRGALNA